MRTAHDKSVVMPRVPEQRWSCHSCGNCCRTLVIHLSGEERVRIAGQGWVDKLGVDPCVRVGGRWVLNKREDGSCVFLDENTRCRIHNEFGEGDKPLACRMFPFSIRPVQDGWQASIRFDCPSMALSKGKPIGQHRPWITALARDLDYRSPGRRDHALLQRGACAIPEETDAIVKRFVGWLEGGALPMSARLIGAARVTTTLADARYKKVRGERLAELLDLLFGALPAECASSPEPSTPKQQGMLRQLAFAHAEHVTLAEMRSGLLSRLGKRKQQLRNAQAFLQGQDAAAVPQLPGFSRGSATFGEVETVVSETKANHEIEGMTLRYLIARIESRSVFGMGYYGWRVFDGMAALWLSVAVAGWLGRYRAALDGKRSLDAGGAGFALGVVDRAATRLPALGTVAERARVSYLLADDGVARLVNHYSLLETSP